MDLVWSEGVGRWVAQRLEVAATQEPLEGLGETSSPGADGDRAPATPCPEPLSRAASFFQLDDLSRQCLLMGLAPALRPDARVVLGGMQGGVADGLLPLTWCASLWPWAPERVARRVEHLVALGLLEVLQSGAVRMAGWLRRCCVPVIEDGETWTRRDTRAHFASWGLRPSALRDVEATLRGWVAMEPRWGRRAPMLLVRGPLLASAQEAADAILSLATTRYLIADEDALVRARHSVRPAMAEAAISGSGLMVRLARSTKGLERQRLIDRLSEAPVPVLLVATEDSPGLEPIEAACHVVTSVAALRDADPVAAWERALPRDVEVEAGFDVTSLGRRQPLLAEVCERVVELARWQARGAALTVSDLARAGAARLNGTSRLTDERPTSARLEDLVLARSSAAEFAELLDACRQRTTALDAFPGAFDGRSRGIVSLFHGPPGTGKTFAAEVVAAELGVPLRVIVVSDLVSQRAGETDERLRDLFEKARGSRSVLLFDEADGLFGCRVAADRASDRHANVSSGMLLQELERYDGVVVLTTHLPGAIDPAFQRRIRYSVEFPEPEAAERQALWDRRLEHMERVADDVDTAQLARAYPLTGARIRNAIIRAVYAAAARSSLPRITRAILDEYARRECADAGVLLRVAPAPRR